MAFTAKRWTCLWAVVVLTLAWAGSTPSRGQDNPGPQGGIHVTVNGGGAITATMTITAGRGGAAATQPDEVWGTSPATQPNKRAVMNVAGRTVRPTTQPAAAPLGVAPGAGPAVSAGLMENGPMQSVAEPMGRLIQLSLKGTGIQLDRGHWDEPATAADPNAAGAVRGVAVLGGVDRFAALDRVFRQLASAQRNRGSASGNWGMNERISTFTGDKLSGKLEMYEDRVTIAVTEETEPRRRLEVSDGGDGTVRLILSNSKGDMVLLTQSPKGAVAVVWLVDGKTEAAGAESYAALYRAKRGLLNQQVLPVLKHMSVDLLIWPDSPAVYQAAAALLAPVGQEQEAAGRKLIKQLDSDEFKTREAATKELTDQYGRYRILIAAAAADATASPEAADRLRKILDLHPEDQKVGQLIAGMGLLDDPVFLAGVLGSATQEQRPAVVGRLEKVTGQKLGNDPAMWKKWAENR